MKKFLALAIAFVVILKGLAQIPESKAPLVLKKAPIEASILNTDTKAPAVPEQVQTTPQKSTLLNLLEMTIDQDHDLSKGIDIVDSTPSTEANQKILELYEAKINARGLNFEKADELLRAIDDSSLAILKAAVLIAKDDRDRAGDYLHDLIDNNPDAVIKSQAMALLNVYYTYDRHRDADVSYLWVLFAQKLGEWGELEISQYLAQKAIDRNHEYRDAWIIKGYDELTLKKPSDAELSLLTAYRLDPGNSHIQYLLGLTYFDLNSPAQSTQFLLYAKDNGEQYHDVINEKLAENAIKTNDFPLATHYYESLLEESPKDENALTRLTWLYSEQLHEPDKALDTAKKLVEDFPSNPKSYELLNYVTAKKNNPAAVATSPSPQP